MTLLELALAVASGFVFGWISSEHWHFAELLGNQTSKTPSRNFPDDYHELLPGDSQEEIIRKLNGNPKEEKPSTPPCWCGHTKDQHGTRMLKTSSGREFFREDACLICETCDEFEFEIFPQEKLR